MTIPAKAVFIKIIVAISMLAALFLFVRQCAITYQDSVNYGGTDLRVRIVGSRLMAKGSNAYFARWVPGQPETLCDPNDNFAGFVNGVTATPFLLWLQQPLAILEYPKIRMLWWGAQQFLLLSVIAFFVWFYRHSWQAVGAVVLAAGVLINLPFWFLHADRGQVYILYAAWMTVLFALWNCKSTGWVVVTGVWLAIGVLLRPPLGIFALLSFVLLNNKKRLLMVTASVASIVIFIWLSGGWQYWSDYLNAMNIYTTYAITGSPYMQLPVAFKPPMPVSIEGATNLTLYKDYSFIIYMGSLHNYFNAHHWYPGTKLYAGIFLGVGSVLSVVFLQINKYKTISLTQYFMLAILLYLLAEVCQPLRMAYNLIQWLPALLAAVGFIFSSQKTAA